MARHKDAVYRQMVRVCGNHDDAEDVLVEALLSAYRASEQLRDEAAFRGWVATIGRRVCGRLRKKESNLSLLSLSAVEGEPAIEPVASDDVADAVEQRDMRSCVHRVIESLPELYRTVYWMREIEGIPAEEVGRQLGLSVPAVKSRLHRARAMVRSALDESMCGPPG